MLFALGCVAAPQYRSNSWLAPVISELELNVTDPLLGFSTRRYRLSLPPQLDSTPRPLLLGFHGQNNTGDEFATAHDYEARAAALGWIMVHPWGMDIQQDPGHDIGWDCPGNTDDSTCLPGTTNNWTHASCAELGRISRCNWATCYDDIFFVTQLLRHLEATFSLDKNRYAVVGQSNGAMFIHHLITSLPGRFRAAVPCFGLPLLGFMTGAGFELLTHSAAAQRTALLSLHGRSDPTIPPQGGRSADGWLYETLNRTTATWAALHAECDASAPPEPVQTPWDVTAGSNLRCTVSCRGGAGDVRVAACTYDGGHGYATNITASDALVWSWLTAAFEGAAWPPTVAAGRPVSTAPMRRVLKRRRRKLRRRRRRRL